MDLQAGASPGTKSFLVEIESSDDIALTMAGVNFGDSLYLPLLRDDSGAKVLAAVLPEIPEHTYSVVTLGISLNFAWVAELTGEPVTLTLPDPPTLISPLTGATDVTTATVFEVGGWSGPVIHMWQPLAPGAPTISLTTMAGSVTIPDTTDLGLALPASTSYSWQVLGRSGASVEAATLVGQDLLVLFSLLFGQASGPTGTGAFTLNSGVVNFTTAP